MGLELKICKIKKVSEDMFHDNVNILNNADLYI